MERRDDILGKERLSNLSSGKRRFKQNRWKIKQTKKQTTAQAKSNSFTSRPGCIWAQSNNCDHRNCI